MTGTLLELIMIVKNSGKQIINTLNSIKNIIDCYTILDTGSSDNTIQHIKDTLQTIPGHIFQEPFVDFSTTRNRSLDLSQKNCKYQLILDDTYELVGAESLITLLKQINTPGFAIKITNHTNDVYYSYRIIRTSDNIRYKYKVHELLQFNNEKDDVFIINKDNIYIRDIVDPYMIQRTQHRIYQDLNFLQSDLLSYPNDPRIFCYLGIVYFILNDYKQSISYFEKCISNKNNKNYCFISYSYLYSIYKTKSDVDISSFLHDFKNTFPDRAEPLFFLSLNYYSNKQYKKTLRALKIASKINIPDTLFPIDTNIYTKEIPFLLCETLFLCKEYQKTSDLLEIYHKKFTNNFRIVNMIFNMTHSLPCKSITLEKEIIVFCIHHTHKSWSPNEQPEHQIIHLSKKLSKNYRVFVFGNVQDGIYDGIEYFNHKHLLEFCNNYKIKTLIVTNDTNNLLYLPNIEGVILWLYQDITSHYLQYHQTKLKKIICNTQYQIDKVKNQYNIPNYYLDTYIDTSLIRDINFNDDISKIKHRFMYTGDTIHGLEYVLDMIPFIKDIFPDTTLYIFVKNKLSENLQNIIEHLDYVFCEAMLPYDKLYIEYQKSDVWFYPTSIPETSFDLILLSQLSKCLCVTSNLGILSEAVKNKGIILEGEIKDINVQHKMIQKIKFVLDNTIIKNNLISKAFLWSESIVKNDNINKFL